MCIRCGRRLICGPRRKGSAGSDKGEVVGHSREHVEGDNGGMCNAIRGHLKLPMAEFTVDGSFTTLHTLLYTTLHIHLCKMPTCHSLNSKVSKSQDTTRVSLSASCTHSLSLSQLRLVAGISHSAASPHRCLSLKHISSSASLSLSWISQSTFLSLSRILLSASLSSLALPIPDSLIHRW